MKYNNSRLLIGNWSRTFDVSGSIVDSVEDYLKDATLGSEVDVSQYISEVPIKVTVSLRNDGSFETYVDEESYNEALKLGREALKASLKDLISRRLEVSFIETDKDADTLINEALGMDFDTYLDTYGPEVLSPVSSFREQHDYKGYYKSDKDYIYFTDYLTLPLNGEASNEYLISDDTLVINFKEGAYVYTRDE